MGRSQSALTAAGATNRRRCQGAIGVARIDAHRDSGVTARAEILDCT